MDTINCLALESRMHYIRGMSQSLTIRLDEELAATLEAKANKANRSRGQIVRDALTEHLNEDKKTSALQALAKYAGRAKGPTDLSTNKKHMAGFGGGRR